MDYKIYDKKIVLRLNKGDKIIKALEEVANREDITAAHFAGIGAISEMKVGFLRPGQTDYDWKEYSEDMEVTSLVGNITRFEGEPMIHAHITCGRSDTSVVGGHLGEATTSFTMEIFIDLIDGELIKKTDPDLGINLIEF